MSRAAVAVLAGLGAALALVAVYLAIATVAQGSAHAVSLLADDAAIVTAVAAGFGLQIGLFAYVLLLRRALAREAVALAGAGTTTSVVAMLACCAHHLADVAPLVAASGVAVFLVEAKLPLVALGLAANAAGVVVMARELVRARRTYAALHAI